MSNDAMTTTLLDQIIASGNRPALRPPYNTAGRLPNQIRCADGFTLSVIAGDGTYCTPRPSDFSMLGEVPADYPGPYTAVEVGFPSDRPEPWETWSEYVESPDDPTGTVYSYVPVDVVRALVAAHGGEA